MKKKIFYKIKHIKNFDFENLNSFFSNFTFKFAYEDNYISSKNQIETAS